MGRSAQLAKFQRNCADFQVQSGKIKVQIRFSDGRHFVPTQTACDMKLREKSFEWEQIATIFQRRGEKREKMRFLI
jgi:hypothetical protein